MNPDWAAGLRCYDRQGQPITFQEYMAHMIGRSVRLGAYIILELLPALGRNGHDA